MKKLDIGSGYAKKEGYITLDKDPIVGADIQQDLDVFPWAIEDGSIDEIRAHHILEHVKPENKVKVMAECWRILKDDGILDIEVPVAPHATAYQDPTHYSFWVRASFWYYQKDNAYYNAFKQRYSECKVPCFDIVSEESWEHPVARIKLKKAYDV